MLKKSAYLGFFLIFFVLLTLNFVSFQKKTNNNSTISGHIFKQHCWNNYGRTVKLYQKNKLIAEQKTALNGSFYFSKLPAAAYELYFFENQFFIAKKIIALKNTPQQISISYQDKYIRPLFFNEIIGLIIS